VAGTTGIIRETRAAHQSRRGVRYEPEEM